MEDTMETILVSMLGALAGIFFGESAANLAGAIMIVSTAPAPNLANAGFKSIYATSYGLSIIIAIFAMIIRFMFRDRRDATNEPLDALLVVPKTVIWVFILPIACGLAIVLSVLSSRAILQLIEPQGVAITTLSQGLTLTSPLGKIASSMLTWFLSFMLMIEITYVGLLIFILLIAGPVVIALRDAGDYFGGVFELYVGLLLVLVFAQPMITGWLALAAVIQSIQPPSTPTLVAAYNLINILIACLIPVGAFVLYCKKIAPYVGGRVTREGDVIPRQSGPIELATSATALSFAGAGIALKLLADAKGDQKSGQSTAGQTSKLVGSYAARAVISSALRAHPHTALLVTGATALYGAMKSAKSDKTPDDDDQAARTHDDPSEQNGDDNS